MLFQYDSQVDLSTEWYAFKQFRAPSLDVGFRFRDKDMIRTCAQWESPGSPSGICTPLSSSMMAVELILFHDPFVCLLESNSGGQGQADKDSPCASRPPRRANADGPIWQKVSLRVCFHARILKTNEKGILKNIFC